jgi:hypothetical protein
VKANRIFRAVGRDSPKRAATVRRGKAVRRESGFEPHDAFLSCRAGRPWRTTHGAAGERKRLLHNVTAEHFSTEDHVRREANERRRGFRGHQVSVRCLGNLPQGLGRSDDCTRRRGKPPGFTVQNRSPCGHSTTSSAGPASARSA